MDQVARLPAGDRQDLIVQTANRTGLSPRIIEKDFWVCWTLSRLFAMEGLPRLLFKGGTSLSKCFQLIERFSEDIDLGIEREDIGLGGPVAPSPDKGSTRLKRARRELREGARRYVKGPFLEALQADFALALHAPYKLLLVPDANEPVLEFQYPRALASGSYGGDAYIASAVRLELGARSDHFPTESVELASYTADHFPEEFSEPICTVIAQAPVRTLLEKSLILHTDMERGRVSPRSSRHAYDLLMMWRAGTAEEATRDLYEQVALHKRVFSGDHRAGRAPERGIRMTPAGAALRALEADYRDMEQMFFSDPPRFEEIIEGLRLLEAAINAMA